MIPFVDCTSVQEQLLMTLIDKVELLAEAHQAMASRFDEIVRATPTSNVLQNLKPPGRRTENEEASEIQWEISRVHKTMAGFKEGILSATPIVHQANIAHLKRNGFDVRVNTCLGQFIDERRLPAYDISWDTSG